MAVYEANPDCTPTIAGFGDIEARQQPGYGQGQLGGVLDEPILIEQLPHVRLGQLDSSFKTQSASTWMRSLRSSISRTSM